MEYRVSHRTVYRYLQDVSSSCHLSHLVPRETALQQVEAVEMSLSPSPSRRFRRHDYFGNTVEWFYVDEPHTTLEVLARSRVKVAKPPAPKPEASVPWSSVREDLERAHEQHTVGAVQYIFDSPLTAFRSDVAAYAAKSFPEGRPLLAGAIELMGRIHADFRYDTTVTDAVTPVDRVFEIRAGVCQDLAHVGIACFRSLGLAVRYVSGYLLTRPPPGQARLLGADASHAWYSVWVPPYGWVDFDPTNNILPGDGHITVAWGRDFGDVSPLSGIVTGGGEHMIEIGVDVLPVT